MKFRAMPTGVLAAGLFLFCAAPSASALPITPSRDDEVVEVLPAAAGNRGEERQLRKRLAARPDDPVLALAVARRYLDQARESGDPRYAGLALAALRAWPDPAVAPFDILLMRATLQQYLHEFDAAVANLRLLLKRPAASRQPQAWLTLATVLRVQGRYADSDEACREVARAGATLYASACQAENAALRGEVDVSRQTLERLLADPRLPNGARGWLLTSLAELEERDGRAGAADAAYRGVLRLGPDSYASVAYADFLIAQKRPLDALKLLKGEARTDAVLLRLAIAGTLAAASRGPGSKTADSSAPDVAEMRDRIALANERPEARIYHGREQAMFALFVDHAPDRALSLARGDVANQREPLDLLVFAQAARAVGSAAAIQEARRLKAAQGLHDRRIDALL
ncbi:MAG: hypothetical protein M3Z29_09660 [Pseudomonadota bacterium]|nr:hypothetical protein [Pseudomonadota bacterium]